MRRNLFLIVFFIMIVLAGLAVKYLVIDSPVVKTQTLAIDPTPSPVHISAEKLMSVVNDWRYTQGFQPYTKSELLCSFASKRLPEIEDNFSHDEYFQHVYTDLPPKTYSAENLARGYSDEQEALNAWVNSPEHRKNLDANYRYSCIKCANNYCVQIFANYE